MTKINGSSHPSYTRTSTRTGSANQPTNIRPTSKSTVEPEDFLSTKKEQDEQYRTLANAIAKLKGKEGTTYVDESIIRQIMNDAEKIEALKKLVLR